MPVVLRLRRLMLVVLVVLLLRVLQAMRLMPAVLRLRLLPIRAQVPPCAAMLVARVAAAAPAPRWSRPPQPPAASRPHLWLDLVRRRRRRRRRGRRLLRARDAPQTRRERGGGCTRDAAGSAAQRHTCWLSAHLPGWSTGCGPSRSALGAQNKRQHAHASSSPFPQLPLRRRGTLRAASLGEPRGRECARRARSAHLWRLCRLFPLGGLEVLLGLWPQQRLHLALQLGAHRRHVSPL